MVTKAQRDMQQRKMREERTAETINPLKSSMDDGMNILKSFFASRHDSNVDKVRYMFLQGFYMTVQRMGPNHPHPPRLVQKLSTQIVRVNDESRTKHRRKRPL